MDENTITGAGKRIAGRIEGAAGAVLGDAQTEASGGAREIGGEAQRRYGEAADALRSFASDQPLIALAAAGMAGLILGIFLARR